MTQDPFGSGSVNALVMAAAAISQRSLQVMQPVTMTTPQGQRTTAYLQHSIAPLPSNLPPPAFPQTFPVMPTRSSGGPSFYSAAFPEFSGPSPFMPMPMPLTVALPVPQQQQQTTLSANEIKEITAEVTTSMEKKTPEPLATNYLQLKNQIRENGSAIKLPPYNEVKINIPIPLELVVKNFISGTILLDTFALIEYTCRRAAALPPDTSGAVSMIDVAKHILSFFGAVNQLPGWLYCEQWITANTTNQKIIPELINKGNSLIMGLLSRLQWVLNLQTASTKHADPEILMRVLSADRVWASDSTTFMKEAEVKVTAMLTENQPKFHQFREAQRKGVPWPHTPSVRKDIEAAGLVFRPMMIKRDRCICETCQVEVSGWRAWQCPWAYHDYSRHLPNFLEKAIGACKHNTVVMVVLNDVKIRLAPPPRPPILSSK